MAITQRARLTRKPTGGLYHPAQKKKLYELGRKPTNTTIEKKHAKRTLRTKGGGTKTVTIRAHDANIYNPKTKTHEKATIKTETGNPANINYVRRNILTKGAIIETSIGKARITSRPGQNGSVEGILIE